jgi:multiple sugar transport system permease protein
MTAQTGGAPPPASLTTAASTRAAAAPAAETRSPGTIVRRILYFAALFGATLIFVFPFVWLVSASLKTRQTVFNTELFPLPLHFENYTRIFEVVPLAN